MFYDIVALRHNGCPAEGPYCRQAPGNRTRGAREERMMKKKKLSDRQRFILSFIRDYMQEHGYAPSIREIKSEVESAGLVRTASGNTSTSVVDYNLRALEEAGYIRRDRNKSREIEIVYRPGR